MKRLLIGVLVLVIGLSTAGAQEATDASFLERLGLEQQEIEQVLAVQAEAEQQTRLARAELDLLRARLTRELVEENPDRDEIRGILRETVEWEYELRLARVETELSIRAIVGDRTWSRMVEARRRMEQSRGRQGAQN